MSHESDAEAQAWQDMIMREHLRHTVAVYVEKLAGCTDAELMKTASLAAGAVAHQGASLIFGSRHKFGHGTAEVDKHLQHEQAVDRRIRRDWAIRKCRVCSKGEPSYSAGEVAGQLARGLAAAVLLTGAADFKGLHWCVRPHEGCPRRQDGEAT